MVEHPFLGSPSSRPAWALLRLMSLLSGKKVVSGVESPWNSRPRCVPRTLLLLPGASCSRGTGLRADWKPLFALFERLTYTPFPVTGYGHSGAGAA